MLRQLEEAENELKRKQDDADQDMMMAGMVRAPRRGPEAASVEGCSLGKGPPPPMPFSVNFGLALHFLVKNWVSSLRRRQRIWFLCQVLMLHNCPVPKLLS